MSREQFTLYIDMHGNNSHKRYHVVNTDSKRRIRIDPTQTWFWTDEWQAGEKQVDAEYEQGLTEHFDTIDELFNRLNP